MGIREKIIDTLVASGIYFDRGNEEADVDLREYITDSLQFINFIVELEKELDIEFPDEALVYDNLASLNGFNIIVESIQDGSFTVKDESRSEEVETP
jgi:acyl carrier protein